MTADGYGLLNGTNFGFGEKRGEEGEVNKRELGLCGGEFSQKF